MRKIVHYGYCLRSDQTKKQLIEIVNYFQLRSHITPFQRCFRCNSILQPVQKNAIIDRLKPLTKFVYTDFHQCTHCNKIYWKGSHYDHMLKMITEI
jgi:hypothetical protein